MSWRAANWPGLREVAACDAAGMHRGTAVRSSRVAVFSIWVIRVPRRRARWYLRATAPPGRCWGLGGKAFVDQAGQRFSMNVNLPGWRRLAGTKQLRLRIAEVDRHARQIESPKPEPGPHGAGAVFGVA